MVKIEFIRNKKDTNLLLLGVAEEEERSSYTVSERTYSEIGRPAVGEILSDEAVSLVKYSDEEYRARKKALSLLSFADNNERALTMKLLRHGYRREIAEATAAQMVSFGYINEEKQLLRLVSQDANIKLYGAGKIIPRLAAKGYSVSDINSALRSLVESGEIDFAENARKLIEKKLPCDASGDERKKLLYKYGYKIC